MRFQPRSAAQPSRVASFGAVAHATSRSGSTTEAMKLRFSNSCCCVARGVTLPRASISGISVRPARVRGRSTRVSPSNT